MTKTQYPFCIHPFVGNDAHHGRHDAGGYAECQKHTAYLHSGKMKCATQVNADRDQPCAPDKVLKKVHDDQTKLDIHCAAFVFLIIVSPASNSKFFSME